MTYEDFVGRAIREFARRAQLPRLWWGTYRDAHGPDGARVFFSGNAWTVVAGRKKSRHDSRASAFSAARKRMLEV